MSKELKSLYKVLSFDNKRIFGKVYTMIWDYLMHIPSFKRYSGVLYAFWIVDNFRASSNIPSRQLALLSYLYHISDKGTKYVHSDRVVYGQVLAYHAKNSKRNELNELRMAGYIARSFNNPDEPYYKRSYLNHPMFIRLLPSGIQLIQSFEKALSKSLHDVSFDELTGVIKKPVSGTGSL